MIHVFWIHIQYKLILLLIAGIEVNDFNSDPKFFRPRRNCGDLLLELHFILSNITERHNTYFGVT